MQKYKVLVSAFFIMLCLGGIYAWSVFAFELKKDYFFTATQTQMIFGTIIAIFPLTMIFVRRIKFLSKKQQARYSAFLFMFAYLIAGFSRGNYTLVFISLGVFTGIATGTGYLLALTVPLKWFPGKTGFVTGIIAAGFGLASVILPFFVKICLFLGLNILNVFLLIGLIYGTVMIICSKNLVEPDAQEDDKSVAISDFVKKIEFIKLSFGMFLGTFAGLLVIGNLKSIGALSINNYLVLISGISLFSLSNFTGRITWGYLSDHKDNNKLIFTALSVQAVSIFLLLFISGKIAFYLILSGLIGFCFGSNFVLFAKQTALKFGLDKMTHIYPYVFLAYGFAGIVGPTSGGKLFDIYKSFHVSIVLATIMSISGALIFSDTVKLHKIKLKIKNFLMMKLNLE